MTSGPTLATGSEAPRAEHDRRWMPSRAPARFKNFFVIKGSQLGLLFLVVGTIAAAFGWPYFWPSEDRLRIGISIADGSGPSTEDIGNIVQVTTDRLDGTSPIIAKTNTNTDVVLGARYLSVDNQGRPFSITADIIQASDDLGPNLILTKPNAEMTLDEGDWMAIVAEAGVYDRVGQVMTLSGNVTLFHDAGYEVRTESAAIDLVTVTAEGFDPVRAQGPTGIIIADGFRVDENASRVVFTGNSQATIFPGAGF